MICVLLLTFLLYWKKKEDLESYKADLEEALEELKDMRPLQHFQSVVVKVVLTLIQRVNLTERSWHSARAL